jgi:hypothetical protein
MEGRRPAMLSQISRSQFEIYAYSTRHDPSEAATDEFLQMLTNEATAISYCASAFLMFKHYAGLI